MLRFRSFVCRLVKKTMFASAKEKKHYLNIDQAVYYIRIMDI